MLLSILQILSSVVLLPINRHYIYPFDPTRGALSEIAGGTSSGFPAKLWISMLEMVKASLKFGEFTDWGVYVDINSGNCIGEGAEADAFASILKWTPYVIFDAKPALSVDQAIGEINKTVAESKSK